MGANETRSIDNPFFFCLILSCLSLILPYSYFILFIIKTGLNVALFLQGLFANYINLFFILDVVISAIVLIIFIFTE